MPVEANDLFLTFDDGPIPGPTEFVINELKKHNAKATFFCIGDNVGKYPTVFEKILAEGHEIGNHTFNHLKGWSTNLQKYMDNIAMCDQQITNYKSQTPQQPASILQPPVSRLFRPPYGRITSSQIKALKNQYQIVMWDVLTHDYSKSISPEKCLKGAIKATRPGSIIVFHDSLKAERNLTYVLPKFLDYFTSLGFKFKTLTDV